MQMRKHRRRRRIYTWKSLHRLVRRSRRWYGGPFDSLPYERPPQASENAGIGVPGTGIALTLAALAGLGAGLALWLVYFIAHM